LIHDFFSPDVDGENARDEIIEEKPTAGKISIAAITRVLK
jgi:hypothetical protein